jgi:hypothetical protein
MLRGSAVNMKQRRGRVPSGDKSPMLTVYGNPPQLVRVESEEMLYLAQAIANAHGKIFVVTPSRTLIAEPQTATATAAGKALQPNMAQQPTRPTGILQADQYPVAQNGNGAHAPETPAGMCGRCHGTGTTTRGVCPVCAGRRVAR